MIHQIAVTSEMETKTFYFADYDFEQADRLAEFWHKAGALVIWRQYKEVR